MKRTVNNIEDVKEMSLKHFIDLTCKETTTDPFADFIRNMSLKDFIELDCNSKIEIIQKFGKFLHTIDKYLMYELCDFFIFLEIEDNTFISFNYAPKTSDVDYDSNIFMKN